jgi:restriction system protein
LTKILADDHSGTEGYNSHMTPGEKQTLLEILDELQPDGPTLDPLGAERRMLAALQPLLAAEGYSVDRLPLSSNQDFDAMAHRAASGIYEQQSMVVEIKYRRRTSPLTLNDISRFMIAATLHETNRALIVTNTTFSRNAQMHVAQFVQRARVGIQLLTLDDVRAWVTRFETKNGELQEEARLIVESLAREFAHMIARNARALDHVEWRDLERIVAEVFEKLGFDVELTPSSKDQGRDVILECSVKGTRRSYIIEVKHWRSGARVGSSTIRDFVDVVAREGRDGGVFLSTYGYTGNAFEAITEIERQRVRFGSEEKIAALCRKYSRAAAGLWSPPEVLADIVFEDTE